MLRYVPWVPNKAMPYQPHQKLETKYGGRPIYKPYFFPTVMRKAKQNLVLSHIIATLTSLVNNITPLPLSCEDIVLVFNCCGGGFKLQRHEQLLILLSRGGSVLTALIDIEKGLGTIPYN
ncbi:unnamed protein product [Dovyalis caffra]|uniref:Uncharacterized protein n=1 Tax=Dovyalis caffra TaxID=77055 RepID=A0AAV1SN94_9ROSI|nr:unnamed protein product [Dovyalis caffra]